MMIIIIITFIDLLGVLDRSEQETDVVFVQKHQIILNMKIN
jgi:hypothetical protein